MAKGIKTGGRKKGTLNKTSQALQEIVNNYLEERGLDKNFNPVAYMMAIAADEAMEVDARFLAAKEAAQYFYSKKRAVEHSGGIETKITGEQLDAIYSAITNE